MTNAEAVWRGKSDDEVLEASTRLDEYTDEGREIILAEAVRRDLNVSTLVEAAASLQDSARDKSPTNRCAYCDTPILFRAKRRGALKFCNAQCEGRGVLLSASHQLPDAAV